MHQTIGQIKAALNKAFPERQEAINLLLIGLLTRENVLLLGPPGTAKSLLVRSTCSIFADAVYFEWLLNKFSTPEELFGPPSLKALEQDDYRRVLDGKLPLANIGFVDEVFKANSAILNYLLTLMNEHVFHNGKAGAFQSPLVSLIGASNELPDGKELEAMFDRFLIRYDVKYLVKTGNFKSMLRSNPEAIVAKEAPKVKLVDLGRWQHDVSQVTVSEATVDAMVAMRHNLAQSGIVASDRRWRKCMKLAQAAAYMAGASETCPEDLLILTDCLWREPKERATVDGIVGKVADPVSQKAQALLDAARENMGKVEAITGDRKTYIAKAAEMLENLNNMMAEIDKLLPTAGVRGKANAAEIRAEIGKMHTELAMGFANGLKRRV